MGKKRRRQKRTHLIQTRENGQHLIEFFGADKIVEEITHGDAEQFFRWFSTSPLNIRGKTPKPYGRATIGREIGNFKSVFKLAVDYGYITRNPFIVLHRWEAKNADNMEYVPVENVIQF